MLIVDFEPTQGHEQGGSRRALVVSYEPIHAMGMMTVCPVTAAHTTPRNPLEIPIRAGEAGQTRDGLILVHQVRTVSILRAGDMLSRSAAVHRLTDPGLREQVRQALATQLGLDIPGTEDGALTSDRFGGFSGL
jgi:mRNA-degrading endonuclease toxin of MazEF toxin-antitoxin module